MKIINIQKEGNYTYHGIKYTEHDGSQGTSDNRLPIKRALAYELGRNIKDGEQYQVQINGVNQGTFTK